MILRYDLPRFIERAKDTQTLTADIYSDAGVQQTPSAVALTLYAGSRVVLDEVAAVAAAPSTYALLAASVPTTEALSDRWLELWTATIAGVDYTFRREAFLVRDVLHPVITDEALTIGRHRELSALLGAGETYAGARAEAWILVNRELLNRGSRPHLIMGSSALREVHVLQTLVLIFTDFESSVGDGRYATLADDYRSQLVEAWSKVTVTYDEDEDGTIGGESELTRTVTPQIMLVGRR